LSYYTPAKRLPVCAGVAARKEGVIRDVGEETGMTAIRSERVDGKKKDEEKGSGGEGREEAG
jgi:hypothetical protein